jgi:hypothetical protein
LEPACPAGRHEIVREAIEVPVDLLVEALRGQAIKFSEIMGQHHLFSAYPVDLPAGKADLSGDRLLRDDHEFFHSQFRLTIFSSTCGRKRW